jgi:ribosomal protein S18 acetylase RimI-like enzyme
LEDELGQTREVLRQRLDQCYINAFNNIDIDPNQYLMVVEQYDEIEEGHQPKKIIASCHLTIMPSVTFIGSTRMQIEAVRVSGKYRGQNVGTWMMNAAIEYGKAKGASLFQLTTNKQRPRAKRFYEMLGFQSTHEGMKLYLNNRT